MSWTTRVVHEDTEKVVPKDAIVLDLAQSPRGSDNHYPQWLRLSANEDEKAGYRPAFLRWLADEIEKQTKPPRIPEPGLWGVVSTQNDADLTDYWTSGPGGWFNERGEVSEWHDLRNPVLIREGIE